MTMYTPPVCSDRGLWDSWMSLYYFPAVMIADRLDVFAHVAQRSLTREALAHCLGVETRVAEALSGVFLAASPPFLTITDGRLVLTDQAREYLLPTSPYYYGGVLRDAWLKHSVASLIWHRIRPNEVQDDLLFANAQTLSEIWRDRALDRTEAQHITEVMHSHSSASASIVSHQLGEVFAGVSKLLDVGGGSACFSIEIARRFPSLHCTVLDLAAVCDVAQKYIARSGVSARVETYQADMFAHAWPHGCDVVFLSDILHDWGETECVELAARSYASLSPGGRIVIHELLWNDRKDGPLVAALYSLCMVRATAAGRQYSFAELKKILHAAGFERPTIQRLPGYYSLIVASKQG